MTEPTAKLRLANTRRFTTGFLDVSSHPVAPRMPTAARMAKATMNGELNQSSSSPRSSMICRLPRPSAIRLIPM